MTAAPPPVDDETIEYMAVKTQMKKQRYVKRHFNKIGKKFKDDDAIFQIANVVSEKDKPKS